MSSDVVQVNLHAKTVQLVLGLLHFEVGHPISRTGVHKLVTETAFDCPRIEERDQVLSVPRAGALYERFNYVQLDLLVITLYELQG